MVNMTRILLLDDKNEAAKNTTRILDEIKDDKGNPKFCFLLNESGQNLGTDIIMPNKSKCRDSIRDAAVKMIHREIDNFEILMVDGFLIGHQDEIHGPVSLQIIKEIIADTDMDFQEKLQNKRIILITSYDNRKRYLIFSPIYMNDVYRNRFSLLFRPAIYHERDAAMDTCCFKDENELSGKQKCSLWKDRIYSGKEGSPKCSRKECMLDVFMNIVGVI